MALKSVLVNALVLEKKKEFWTWTAGANRWCKQGSSLEACTCSFSVCHTLLVLDPNLWPCCDYLSSYPRAFLQVVVQIMHDTSLCQELFAAIPDIKSIRAESFFSLLSLLPMYQHSLQRMKDVFSFRIWTCAIMVYPIQSISTLSW